MKNILSLILGLFVTFEEIYGENTTEYTSTTQMETTMIYTTMTYQTLAPIVDDDEEGECDWDYMVDLNDGEDIEISLCGYTDSSGDTDIKMVEITLQLPADRWFGIGFTKPSDYAGTDDAATTNGMKDVYAIIFPLYSRDGIQERYMGGNGDVGDELDSMTTVAADKYENGGRTIKITRLLTVSLNDLQVANLESDWDKYYDFDNFDLCDDTMDIVWAFGAKNNGRFSAGDNSSYSITPSYHGKNNRGYVTAEVEAVLEELCDGGVGDDVNKVSIICGIVISIIAILFN